MKWRGRAKSTNVQDQRGRLGTPRRKVAAGGGLLVLVVGLIAVLLGQDPRAFMEMLGQAQASGGGARPQQQDPGPQVPSNPRHDELLQFASVVLKDTEDIWHELLDNGRQQYREPNMRIFSAGGVIETACGGQTSEVGPFYCPGDSTIYLELGFFDLLEKKLGAKGDFARAYVIAHEVGHHIQNLTGQSTEVHRKQQRASKAEANLLSVRLELQADYLAGVFAHHAELKGYLEKGDLEEALNAASQIGDDVLTKRATGRVGNSESFTHGTGEQRLRWFRKGYLSGDPSGMFETFEVSANRL